MSENSSSSLSYSTNTVNEEFSIDAKFVLLLKRGDDTMRQYLYLALQFLQPLENDVVYVKMPDGDKLKVLYK